MVKKLANTYFFLTLGKTLVIRGIPVGTGFEISIRHNERQSILYLPDFDDKKGI